MEKIHASLVLELLGRPPEYLSESMDGILKRLSSEKGVQIKNKKLHLPIPLEKSKDLFTSFIELEAEFDSINHYLGILFAYMPSNVEIIRPEKIAFSNIDLNDLTNQLVQRLHNYDAIAKNALTERDIILKKLKEAAPLAFKEITKPKDSEKN